MTVGKFAYDTKFGGRVDSAEGYLRLQWNLDLEGLRNSRWCLILKCVRYQSRACIVNSRAQGSVVEHRQSRAGP